MLLLHLICYCGFHVKALGLSRATIYADMNSNDSNVQEHVYIYIYTYIAFIAVIRFRFDWRIFVKKQKQYGLDQMIDVRELIRQTSEESTSITRYVFSSSIKSPPPPFDGYIIHIGGVFEVQVIHLPAFNQFTLISNPASVHSLHTRICLLTVVLRREKGKFPQSTSRYRHISPNGRAITGLRACAT